MVNSQSSSTKITKRLPLPEESSFPNTVTYWLLIGPYPPGIKSAPPYGSFVLSYCLLLLYLSNLDRAISSFQIEPEKVSISQEGTSFPCVPLLVLKPSITTSLFSDTVVFFKHLLQICINSFIVQLELPQQIYAEIELKIIDRITNIESCGEGVNLIMNYFTWWTEQKRRQVNPEVQLLLHEIKLYSNFFLQYIWKKTLSGGQDNPEMDNFFCNILPRKLAFLHQIITIYNGQNPFRFVMRISKGLAWLDSLIENESKATLDLATELMQYLQKHSK